MAKKTGRTVRKRSKVGLISPQRKKEILGLILMALAVLVALAVITYHPADEALARNFTLSNALSPHENQAHNWLGLVGAAIAWMLVPNFLGYPVLVLPILLFAWGYVVFRSRTPVFLPVLTALSVAGLAALSATIGWFGHVTESDLMLWSGTVGMAISGWMHQIFGSVGAIVILGLLLIVFLLLLIDHDIQRSMDRIEGILRSIRTRTSAGWERWREASAERAERRQRLKEERRKKREEEERRLRDRQRREAEQTAAGASPTGTPSAHSGAARPLVPTSQRPAADAKPPAPSVAPSRPPTETTSGSEDDLVLDELIRSRHAGPPPADGEGESRDEPELHIRRRVEEQSANLDEERREEAPVEKDLPYEYPSVELLEEEARGEHPIDVHELDENKRILLDKLDTYNIHITHIDAVVGPTVTLYELTPAPGVKISRITALEDDLAMAMAARGIRIIAPIPGKSAVGVEIPNRHRELVRIRDIINTARFRDAKMNLPVALGKTIEGEVYIEDLAKMPHVLIAGATGSGKSVGLNALIAGLLYSCHPSNLKFVIIDPKKIELAQYANTLNHFIAMPEEADDPIITDFTDAVGVLKSCEKEMELRYDLLSDAMTRNITDYNRRFHEGKLDLQNGHRHLPYIVVIIDELADLMLTAGKEIEGPIARLAQMARAVGIHLVLATQRPSVDVITGLIKANFPARVAYQVASKVDSRTILDQNGAEQLVGNGDMLYMVGSRVIRLQGPFISVDEVEHITSFIGRQRGSGPYLLPPVVDEGSGLTGELSDEDETDDLFVEAARIIVRSQQGSVSLLQRKLSIGYTRAARIVDQLEHAGIVGPFEGSKARQVLVQDEFVLDEMLNARS